MKTYTLAPMDQPSVRLSFGQVAGLEPGWLPWPTPDALACSVRRWLRLQPRSVGCTWADQQSCGVRGPWLVGLDAEARPMARWVPAPADACLRPEGAGDATWVRCRWVPEISQWDTSGDMGQGPDPQCIAPIEVVGSAAPPVAWWTWEAMLRWLATPEAKDHVHLGTLGLPLVALAETGPLRWALPPRDWRATTGPVSLVPPPDHGPRLDAGREATLRLSLAFEADARIDGTWVHVGDANEPFALEEDEGAHADAGATLARPEVHPTCGRVRVILLTPGAFALASRPCPTRLEALGVRLVAAAVGHLQWAEGWAEDAGPAQPCRRMAPAGSVYWLDVLDGDAEAWAERHQFDSLCEQPQDRLDGLGQFVVGVA